MKINGTKKRIICILLALVMILMTGCLYDGNEIPEETAGADMTMQPTATPEPTPEIPTENGALKLSVSKYDSLNPLKTDNRDVVTYMSLAFEPLVKIGELMEINKCLATDWVYDSTFKIWEFTIVHNAQFGDGTFLMASDVRATFDYILKNGGNYADNVKNVAGVFVKDNYTVQFVLYEPDANFVEKLSVPILSERTVGDNMPTGTGLFKISGTSGKTVFLTINEGYRDTSLKPHITTVELTSYDTEYEKMTSDFDISFIYGKNTADYVLDGTRRTANFTGDIYNYITINTTATYMISQTTTRTDTVITIDEKGNPVETTETVTETKYYSFPNPFEKKEVRQALSYLISRENVLRSAGSGKGKISLLPAYSGITKRRQKNETAETNTFKAEECLRMAGYTKNADGEWMSNIGERLTIKLLTIATNSKLCSIMRSTRNALEAIGIATEYEAVSEEEYYRKIEMHEYMLAAAETELPDWLDPSALFAYDGALNYSGWKNDRADEYIARLRTINDDEVYNAVFGVIEDVVLTENPIIGLYISSGTAVMGSRLGGVDIDGFYVWDLMNGFCNWFIREEK